MAANLAPGSSPARGPRLVRSYVGLGSNLGQSELTLVEAIGALRALPGARLAGVSGLYATRPVGLEDQPEFRNAVAALDVPAGPDPETGALALLVALKALERAFGRTPGVRWGPRELDLDLLLFGRARLVVERPPAGLSMDAARDLGRRPDRRLLIVPHPEIRDRLFVLAPLADLAPDLVPPGWNETVGEARARRARTEGAKAVRMVGSWQARARRWTAGIG
jgi:2-amino-4-hydroxy-6-hydroxymethyldihydropteridine diphosphokinase